MKRILKWDNRVILAAIFFTAMSARLLKLVLDPMLLRDSAFYLFLAERWETGGYFQTVIDGDIVPPFPIYCIVKLMRLSLTSEIAGRSIGLFLGSIIPVLGYIIAYKTLKDFFVAIITTILLILHPGLVSYSIQPLRENYYLFFVGLMIIAIIDGIKKGELIKWGLCGVFLSFAFFCRYESIEFLVFCPLVILSQFLIKKIDRKRLIMEIVIFFTAIISTSILLMSTINYDFSFITRIANY